MRRVLAGRRPFAWLRRRARWATAALTLVGGTALTATGSTNGGVRLSAYNFPEQYLRHYNAELWLATPGGTHTWDNPALFTEDTTWAVEGPWAP